jgi:hypothetical protein
MHLQTACEALRSGRCLQISYGGTRRIIEVHACGHTKDGREIMRVWQVSGGSASGQNQGWKLMRLNTAWSVSILDVLSQAPRPGYRRGDDAMAEVICQL